MEMDHHHVEDGQSVMEMDCCRVEDGQPIVEMDPRRVEDEQPITKMDHQPVEMDSRQQIHWWRLNLYTKLVKNFFYSYSFYRPAFSIPAIFPDILFVQGRDTTISAFYIISPDPLCYNLSLL